MRSLRIGAFAALLIAAACATTPLERRYGEGRYADVARIYDNDPRLWTREGAVYRAIIARALPRSPVYDPTRASAEGHRYLRLFPDGSHAGEVGHLVALVDEVLRLDAVSAACRTELEAMDADTARLGLRLDSLMRVVATQREQYDSLRVATQSALRQRDQQIRALRDELDRLKAIDLGSPRRAPVIPPPDTTSRDTTAPGTAPHGSV